MYTVYLAGFDYKLIARHNFCVDSSTRNPGKDNLLQVVNDLLKLVAYTACTNSLSVYLRLYS